MRALDYSESQADVEETMAFLPPSMEIKIPKGDGIKRKNRRLLRDQKAQKFKDNERFCLPWMVESIVIMIVIAVVFALKIFHAHMIKDSKIIDNSSYSIEKVERTWKNLSIDDIQYVCLDETSTGCKCINPLTPIPRYDHNLWNDAHIQNIKAAENYRNHLLDVVFLGDSIMEGWKGTSFGNTLESKKENPEVFKSMFDPLNYLTLDGLVLAIAGDKSPNLLWRMKNGEIPEYLEAKVYWILIGTNDFLKDGPNQKHCSTEVVLMGIKRVVEEMRMLRPNATIIVNEILPRAVSDVDGKLYKGEDARNVTNGINIVNKQLKIFCDQYEKLECFNVDEVFIKQNNEFGEGKESEYIPNNLMGDYLHPTALGYQLWGEKIVEKLRSVIEGIN